MYPELAIMLQPAAAYRQLAQGYPPLHGVRTLRRPAVAALVIGTAISVAATGRATALLVLSTTSCWSFALLWQLFAAAVAGRSLDTSLTFSQRLDLFFAGHAPWSLWLLSAAAWSRMFPGWTDLYVVLCTVVVPGSWTVFIVYGFFRGAVGLPPSRALLRTAIHQTLIWGFAFGYVAWAVALWPRMIAAFAS